MYKNKLQAAYVGQKHNAKRRQIEFNLTFDEWLKLWNDSGHLPERGRARGKYVMGRNGDTGSYEIGNVKILTREQNLNECWDRLPDRKEFKSVKPRSRPPLSEKQKKMISERFKGKPKSVAQRMKQREAALARWARYRELNFK